MHALANYERLLTETYITGSRHPNYDQSSRCPRDISYTNSVSSKVYYISCTVTICGVQRSNIGESVLYVMKPKGRARPVGAVSYTHLTLPTIYSV